MTNHDERAREILMKHGNPGATFSQQVSLQDDIAQALAQVEREAYERVLALPMCGSWISAVDIFKLAEPLKASEPCPACGRKLAEGG